jgi:transposase
MRGKPEGQPEFLTTINLNQRVPADHPLRGIKTRVDPVLAKLSPLFDELYADEGRPSIPPEQLFKSRILMALYSVRSERLFCEQLAYNLLWLWFLDRELDEGSFDPTVFTHNYDRVLSADAAKLFFAEVYDLSRAEGWTSDQHFTADGTLIEAWASLKSFVRKDGKDLRPKWPRPKMMTPAIRRSTFMVSRGATRRTAARPIRKACCIGKPMAKPASCVLGRRC